MYYYFCTDVSALQSKATELVNADRAALFLVDREREDEQEFARLNAANLMFCEDAGRRLKAMLDARADIADFHVRVEHHESLHAHDAVSVFAKGVKGGYRPIP